MSVGALYEGVVMHERRGARPRRFSQRLYMPMVDVERLGELRLAPLWRAERLAPVSFRRRDFHGGDTTSLSGAIRAEVAARAGFEPAGPVRLLAHHRTWGWCFNPLALYYCYGRDGETLEAVVAEVTNTPWGESHAYVIDVRRGLDHLEVQAKSLHVSPFLPMDVTYRFALTSPGERCAFSVTASRGPDVVFRAAMSLRRRELTRAGLARALCRHPFMTHRVSLGIYLHAAALWLRRVPFLAHPHEVART